MQFSNLLLSGQWNWRENALHSHRPCRWRGSARTPKQVAPFPVFATSCPAYFITSYLSHLRSYSVASWISLFGLRSALVCKCSGRATSWLRLYDAYGPMPFIHKVIQQVRAQNGQNHCPRARMSWHVPFLWNKRSLAEYSFLLSGLFKVKNKLGREIFVLAIFNYHSHCTRGEPARRIRSLGDGHFVTRDLCALLSQFGRGW